MGAMNKHSVKTMGSSERSRRSRGVGARSGQAPGTRSGFGPSSALRAMADALEDILRAERRRAA